MDKQIVVLFLMAIVAIIVIVAFIIIAWYNYRLKNRIIDSGPVNSEATEFLKNLSGSKTESLKWACIIFSGGIGLVLINYIPNNDSSTSLPFGIEAIFIAAGFLAYYLIMRKEQKRS